LLKSKLKFELCVRRKRSKKKNCLQNQNITGRKHGEILAASRVSDRREALLATDEIQEGQLHGVMGLGRKDSNLERDP
jgi:hypothetical protein